MDTKKRWHQVTEEFEGCVQHAGSLVITCELCGRTHFATMEEGRFDEGELEDLREKAKKEPDKYIEDPSYDSISWGRIDGKQAVIGCVCNGLAKYEEFIWRNRHVIARYLKEKSERLAKESANDAKAMKEIPENLA